jgi:hypothetical protein
MAEPVLANEGSSDKSVGSTCTSPISQLSLHRTLQLSDTLLMRVTDSVRHPGKLMRMSVS